MGLYEHLPYVNTHELNLAWILDQVKTLTEEWAATKTEFGDLKTEWASYKEYIDNYFANLDVSQEISDKLDQMARDGSLDALILPYFNAYKAEINTIVGSQNTRMDALSARMDTFSRLPDGSTTGDAELLDIRVGYDGKNWPTAGDAVRGQVFDIHDNMDVGLIVPLQVNAGNANYNLPFKTGRVYRAESTVSFRVLGIVSGSTIPFCDNYVQNPSYGYIMQDVQRVNISANAAGTIYFTDMTSVFQRLEDKLDKSAYENVADFQFTASATKIAVFPVKSGHNYKIVITGNNNIGVNFYAGYNINNKVDVKTGMVSNHTYFVHYSGQNYPLALVFANGLCNVHIEDLDTITSNINDRLTVTVDNAQDFLTALDDSQHQKMEIVLEAGVYDLIQALGEAYFSNAPARNFGPVLCNDVIVRGCAGAVIKAHYTGANANTKQYFAPFNTGMCVYPWTLSGGFTLENLKIEGSNIRYLVHDENNQFELPYNNIYKNCTFDFDNTQNDVWTSFAIIGGGLGKHGEILIENCVFTSRNVGVRAAVVSYHNTMAQDAFSHIVFTGNVIRPNNAVFRLGYHGPSQLKSLVIASNNLWGGVPSLSFESPADTEENFELLEFNNTVIP